MTEPIPAITLPPSDSPDQEAEWLQNELHEWLDQEFLPELVNQKNRPTCCQCLSAAAHGRRE